MKTNFSDLIKKYLLKRATEINKDLAWFRYAKRTKSGAYRFLANRERQWRELTRLAESIVRKHPNLKLGQIVDWLSDLVNK